MTLEEYFQQFGSGFAAGPLLALPLALLGAAVVFLLMSRVVKI